MKSKRYYATQYGYVWSMNAEGMLRFLSHGQQGKEFNLDHFGKQMKTFQPSLGRAKEKTTPRRLQGAYVAIMPCDWSPERWRNEMELFREYFQKNEL